MAPILSLTKECLDRIREDNSLAVVFIWEIADSSESKISCRSGFVFHHDDDKCLVLTLSKGLDLNGHKKIFVQFENGQSFEGFVTFAGPKSNLAAISVGGLSFEPKDVLISQHEVDQCDVVVHMGFFDEENAKLNFSSGMVGLVDHNNERINNQRFTRFSHCCSEKLYYLGAPVFNVCGELVGVNYSQKDGKDLFFALNLEQLNREFESLFGEDMEHLASMMKGVESNARAKRRKTQ